VEAFQEMNLYLKVHQQLEAFVHNQRTAIDLLNMLTESGNETISSKATELLQLYFDEWASENEFPMDERDSDEEYQFIS